MKTLTSILAGVFSVGTGLAACTKPEKSSFEAYVEELPKDYAEYYLRFYPAFSCRPADKAAEELYDKVVRSAVSTTTFSSGGGSAEKITRSGW